MSKNWSLAIIVAFILGFSVKAYINSQQTTAEQNAKAQAQQVLNDPIFFSQDNKPVHIFDPNIGKIRLLYFGYTRCPDVCPTSLAILSAALSSLTEQELAQLWPMFISIDPERDKADAANQYAQYFHPLIQGFSAPMSTTKVIADHYGVIYKKTELKDSAIEYVVDHSSYFYFVKPDGSLINKLPHSLDPTPIIDTARKILANPTQQGKSQSKK